ncbi:MAG: MBL fold metallo-hydrolase [Flavobacteriaceae bacterium]|nr:MBL fold metallo-hydrolase [Eudoraea sp.]NNJ38684.1 MBL fold metallo-hydrolase [Flavobacteriaceae bacterium]
MKPKFYFCLICLLLFGMPLADAQQDEVVIKTDQLSPDVYMLTGQGGNIGIYVGEEYVLMVDDQFNRLSEKIKAAIRKISDKPIRFLFNTHMHGDHTGGNAAFNAEGTTIVAHDNVRTRVRDNNQKKLDAKEISPEFFGKMLPELTFSDDIRFYDGEETIMAFHVHEAHTDGDAMMYFMNNNVLHMGDTYFAGRYPYIDLNSGGSVNGLIAAQKRALMLINEETTIIPGHGSPSNRAELQAYISMLENLKSNIEQAIADGKSLEEVQADPDIGAAYDATHGGGFINPERMRTIFYSSLKEK